MARRSTTNKTGIPRIEGVKFNDAWIAYSCVSCQKINYIRIGDKLLTPSESIETAIWRCEYCGYIHSKESELPFDNWPEGAIDNDSMTVLRFWEGFFRIATEHPESYYKQCNVCGRILPFQAFSKHTGWGVLQRQMECRCCKGAINALLNPQRTKEQLHESSVRRRIADLFVEESNEKIDIDDLFKRFDGKCFKTKEPLDIKDRTSWAIDHIMPSKYLYPLTKENAALLSKSANENKRDMWPSKFYTNQELIELAKITGANIELISNRKPILNHNIDVNNGVARYLSVREKSDLPKRIKEIKKIIQVYELSEGLSDENKKLLGLI